MTWHKPRLRLSVAPCRDFSSWVIRTSADRSRRYRRAWPECASSITRLHELIRIVSGHMASGSQKTTRRIIVIIVPPVDELDLVGPLQVFNSVNRLAGRPIYTL